MDPTHHEKIVDKLMQYRGKIPKTGHLGSEEAQYYCKGMRNQIDFLISQIEWFASCFNKELIK